jgi:hypothetical protein
VRDKRTNLLRNGLLASFASLGSFVATGSAHAVPYAFASNVISSLTVTTLNGSSPGRITPTGFSETISDASAFGDSPSQTFAAGSATPGTALTITQAFSGTSSTPANIFSALGLGSFTGTRANSAISAGDATNGGVAVDNVAEGSGNNSSFGTSSANNKATIGFVIVGNGEKVILSFVDLFAVGVSTGAVGESANASIANTFSVFDSANHLVAEYGPSALNTTIGSTNGTVSSSGGLSQLFSFTTPDLILGQTYTLALTSGSSENIFPGIALIEPSALSMMGLGLIGLGVLGRRNGKSVRNTNG